MAALNEWKQIDALIKSGKPPQTASEKLDILIRKVDLLTTQIEMMRNDAK